MPLCEYEKYIYRHIYYPIIFSLIFLILYSLEMCKNATYLSAHKDDVGYKNTILFQDCSKPIFILDLLLFPSHCFLNHTPTI